MNKQLKAIAIFSLGSLLTLSASADEKRFPQLVEGTLEPAQHQVAEDIMKFSVIGLAGPYNVMLRSPVLAQQLISTMQYLRFNSSVSPRLNELAILIQAKIWQSDIEWATHSKAALHAGLSPALIDALFNGHRPDNMTSDEAAVYDLVSELSVHHSLSDDTFAQARKVFSEQQIVDLVSLSGLYNSIAMLIATGQETMPDGAAPFSKTASTPATTFQVDTDSTINNSFSRAQFGKACGGQDVSPHIVWHNAPAGTKSFIVTINDQDARTGFGWWHMAVANIPNDVNSLPAGVTDKPKGQVLKGAQFIQNDAGDRRYGGICPPAGQTHRYAITVTALNVDKLDIPAHATPAMIALESQGKIVGKAVTLVNGGM